MQFVRFIRDLQRDLRGTSAVEYGMILSLIVLGMLSALSGVADETLKMWTNIATKSAKAHNGGN